MTVAEFVHWSRQHAWTVSLVWLLGLLCGSYAGGVIAEFRTAYRAFAPGLRTASLHPRRAPDYIGPWARQWPIVLGAVGLVAASYGFAADRGDWWLPAAGAGAAVIAVVTALVTRYILERPQATEAPDLAAADDAVRSRSLHALAGTAVGIQLWLVSLAISGLALTRSAAGSGEHGVLLVVFGLVIPVAATILGRRLGGRAFAVRAQPLEPAR